MKIQKRIRIKNSHILLLLLAVLSYSCISQRRLIYLERKPEPDSLYHKPDRQEYRVKKGDELVIRVSSLDDVAFNFFSEQADNRLMNFSNEVSVSLISYIVNDSGYIYFPILEYIYVENLTIEEITSNLKTQLEDYFNQPTVLIKLVNKEISIIGEVLNPGRYYYTEKRLNIFEALSMAGDITIYGNRKKVKLLREDNNKVTYTTIDLTKREILDKNEFYVQNNDVIYVMPLRSRQWREVSTPWSLTISVVTTFVLILNYIRLS
jgi:polysaccharide export outer membrane protein